MLTSELEASGNELDWVRVFDSSKGFGLSIFVTCPFCGSNLFVARSRDKIESCCECNFVLDEKDFGSILALGVEIGLCRTKAPVAISGLPSSILARSTNGIIELNEKYCGLVNHLNVGFDRVLFWLFVLGHESVHIYIEKKYHKVRYALDMVIVEAHDMVISDPTMIPSLERENGFYIRTIDTIRRNQERIANKHMTNLTKTRYAFIYEGFLRVYLKLPPYAQQMLMPYIDLSRLTG